VFIDEAYSLLNDSRDPYGLEALTTLNLFMSENPESIVVIFAGYEDLLQNGIFKAQPGLPRRCMWQFKCEGYNGPQLASIFYRQLEKEGWDVVNRKAVTKLITKNLDLFPSFGGDTERLSFFSQLEASRETFLSTKNTAHIGIRTLTIEQIKRGLERLKENNIHKVDPKPNYADLTNPTNGQFSFLDALRNGLINPTNPTVNTTNSTNTETINKTTDTENTETINKTTNTDRYSDSISELDSGN
jgi:hypothetical protein